MPDKYTKLIFPLLYMGVNDSWTVKVNDIVVITRYLCPPGMKMMNILVHHVLVGCVSQYCDMNIPSYFSQSLAPMTLIFSAKYHYTFPAFQYEYQHYLKLI